MIMGPRVKDLTGLQVGLLAVIRFSFVNYRGQAVWLCQCACGNTREVIGTNLTSREPTQSCGCFKMQVGFKNRRRPDES